MNAFATRTGIWKLMAAIAVAVVGVNVSDARADHLDPAVRGLTASLNRAAQRLGEEIHFDLRRAPAFEHLQEDAAELVSATQHLQEVAASRGSVTHMLEDLEEIRNAQQHLAHVLRQTSTTPAVNRAMSRVEHLMFQLEQVLNATPSAPPPCTMPQPVLPPPTVLPPPRSGTAPVYLQPFNPRGFDNRTGLPPARGVTVQFGNIRLGFVDRSR